ncbi:TetR/AcrR family transcriptional regulator [Dyadobacter sandarakinus]|uniref:TetR/AcrR family transcriptional regulator n=1 Tax=Dyadobacter sandarakinus TaxID=2747268 RepID=A0ABX7I9G6_9BACT|nr:TetR/AcrR family transcriptional regulator [Dyadobacter sandarakinus]QRR02425.1 TetR/AcrR family transcriptional regulator [Dyadobacter sandarakinus]
MLSTREEILRNKILAGADRLFRENGLAKTTMEDIAREAGKGKSTLYYYFSSKEEIFDVIVQSEKDKFFTRVQDEVSKVPTAREKLRVLTRMRFENIKIWVNLYNVMVREFLQALGDGTDNAVAHYRRQYDQKLVKIISSILQYGIVSGEFKVLSDTEIELLSFVITSAIHGIEMDLVMYNRVEEVVSRTDFFQDLLVDGLKKA